VQVARIAPDKLCIAQEVAAVPEKALALVVGNYTCYLPLASLVDLDQERARIQSEIAQVEQELARGSKLLANPGFTGKAPADVVQKERGKLADNADRRQRLVERLAELG
jgi:valyl-tRNA synthetase